MIVIHSPEHARHHSQCEVHNGALVPSFESPRRAEIVLEAVTAADLGPIRPPSADGLAPAAVLHRVDYLRFLETIWNDWQSAGRAGEAMAFSWCTHAFRPRQEPLGLDARLGYYSFCVDTTINAGTWGAARSAADVCRTAAAVVCDGAAGAFALCRPPGHHAGPGYFGGYCFLNNAGIAAQTLRDGGCARVAVLDVDFHHGNGTQDVFYQRGDVPFASLHGDPRHCFPFYSGHADETGAGPGAGATLNLPLPPGTTWPTYAEALDHALRWLGGFDPDALVVSLGLDTFAGDPISAFRLETDDFPRLGERLASLGKPTVFVLEGGYAAEDLGRNAVGVLGGFESASGSGGNR